MARDIPIERVRELLRYDPETGLLHWKVARGKASVGYVAGCPDLEGYIQVGIEGLRYRAHHLAWLLTHGVWPPDQMDHIDCDRGNNRLANLRLASCIQNQHNRRISSRNTSGLKGAMWNKAAGRWRSIVKRAGVAHFLGYFDTKEEAHAAYCAKVKELHGDFARTH